jgi:septum formation topological specificity factor MinE
LFDSITNNFSKSTDSKNQIQTLLEGDKELLQPKANQSVRHEFVDAVNEFVEIEEDENFKIKRFQGDNELREKAYNTTIMELKV